MRKTALAAALAITVGAGATEAAPIVYLNFNGTFTMISPGGSPWNPMYFCSSSFALCNDPHVTGTITMDMNTGAGSATLQPSVTFEVGFWTAHDITLNATGAGTVHADMMVDWMDYGDNTGISGPLPATWDFSMTPIDATHYAIVTLDGNGDGILGNPLTWPSPDAGFSPTFSGIATVVPVPAAIWLFGSGVLGLIGLNRLKNHRPDR